MINADVRATPIARVPPGPPDRAMLSTYVQLRRDRLRFFLGLTQRYGDVVGLRIGPSRVVLLRHPDAVKHVLQDNNQNYNKQTRGFERLRTLLGDGLLTSEGSFWLRQRRIAQPAFHRQRIAGFGTAMTARTSDMLARWEPYARSGQALDVLAEMMRLTLEIVSETLLGAQVGGADAEAVADALGFALHYTIRRITAPIRVPDALPTPDNLRFRRAKRTLDGVVLGIIEARRRSGRKTEDLLDALMNTRDEETGETMTDAQLRDEVMTMFLAGHETTANALTWTLYLLSRYPAEARRVRDEITRVLAGREPTMADLPALVRTRAVIDEAMRLFPPAWAIGRMALGDDEISGYRVPAGALVFVSPYVTHRHPGVWDDPEGFDPDRMAPEALARLPRYAYFPFGGGPRMCIGNNFALMEAQLVLATILARYRLDLVPGHPVEPEPVITLRPRHGMLMTAHPVA